MHQRFRRLARAKEKTDECDEQPSQLRVHVKQTAAKQTVFNFAERSESSHVGGEHG